MTVDIIIPCFNAAATLERAVRSVLAQLPSLPPQALPSTLWLVDDVSTDETWALVQQLVAEHAQSPAAAYLRMQPLSMPFNSGPAAARNAALWASQAEVVAFLDADDAYADGALAVALAVMHFQPQVGLVRLALHPQDVPPRYTSHEGFARAWQSLCMTVAGNTVWRRSLLMAAGGFPCDALFQRLGGEDAALGIAMTRTTVVGTLFDEPGVHHFWHDGIHAQHLLDAHLFPSDAVNAANASDAPRATAEDMEQAEAVTQRIVQRLHTLRAVLGAGAPAAEGTPGVCPMRITRQE